MLGYNSAMDIKQMLTEIKSQKKLSKNKIVVGTLDGRVIEFLKDRNVPIHTDEIYLTSKGLSHLARDSKKTRGTGLSEDDILKIPDILKDKNSIYFDKGKDRFNLIYCDTTSKKCIKIAVDTKSYTNRKDKVTSIKTAGYIKVEDMNDVIFELIE